MQKPVLAQKKTIKVAKMVFTKSYGRGFIPSHILQNVTLTYNLKNWDTVGIHPVTVVGFTQEGKRVEFQMMYKCRINRPRAWVMTMVKPLWDASGMISVIGVKELLEKELYDYPNRIDKTLDYYRDWTEIVM